MCYFFEIINFCGLGVGRHSCHGGMTYRGEHYFGAWIRKVSARAYSRNHLSISVVRLMKIMENFNQGRRRERGKTRVASSTSEPWVWILFSYFLQKRNDFIKVYTLTIHSVYFLCYIYEDWPKPVTCLRDNIQRQTLSGIQEGKGLCLDTRPLFAWRN